MPVETRVSTIRHGRTAYNAEKRYAGSIDVPLSEMGIQHCRQAALRLDGRRFGAAVTSAMTRAIETARLLVGETTPRVETPLCNERRFGIMEGRTWDEVPKLDPPVLMIEVGNELHTVDPKDGEPFEDVWERAKKFRRFLFESYRGQSVLVVSHGVFLQMLHGLFRGSSCIPSLARFPGNMELAQFRFVDDRLVDDDVEKLIGAGPEPKF
ncbi:MAG: histidine phosphatase family protein [Candidatus Aminicenantales bacterium]